MHFRFILWQNQIFIKKKSVTHPFSVFFRLYFFSQFISVFSILQSILNITDKTWMAYERNVAWDCSCMAGPCESIAALERPKRARRRPKRLPWAETGGAAETSAAWSHEDGGTRHLGGLRGYVRGAYIYINIDISLASLILFIHHVMFMLQISVEAKEFVGLSTVKQHRLVTDSLKTEIAEMHGIRIHTNIPE